MKFTMIRLLALCLALVFSGCSGDVGSETTADEYHIWYRDMDGDGYSDGTTQISVSRPDETYALVSELYDTSEDCNDYSAYVNPGETEICGDGIDQDCDGEDLACDEETSEDLAARVLVSSDLDHSRILYSLAGGEGDTALSFSIDPGGYDSADLEGPWRFHMLATGHSFGWTGWAYGEVTMDASGNLIWDEVDRSDSDSTLPDDDVVSISETGEVTFGGAPPFHGFMSEDRRAVMAVSEDGGGASGLICFQRRSGAFAGADLEGTWAFHMLRAGGGSGWAGRAWGEVAVDAAGNLIWDEINSSDAHWALPGGDVISVSGTGEVRIEGLPSFHGSMSGDKKTLVATFEDDGGGYDLVWMQKCSE